MLVLWLSSGLSPFTFARIKVCCYSICSYRNDDEEREKFWNDLGNVSDKIDNVYRMYVTGTLNGRVDDGVKWDMTVAFGVPGKNESGRLL